MELNYDWRCFQSMFYPKRRSGTGAPGQDANPVYVIVENSRVLSTFGEGEDFSQWQGATYQDMAAEVTHREVILFERKDVDQWIQESLALPHFYDQLEFLRSKAAPQTISRSRFKKGAKGIVLKPGAALPIHRHYLLEALQGWWAKLLPSSFGLFIRLEGAEQNRDLFVIVRRGRVDQFCEPELSAQGRNGPRTPAETVKHLSENFLVPVQGIFVPEEQWQAWSESENPWRQVALAIKSEQAKLVPFRWGVVTLVATRGFLGI